MATLLWQRSISSDVSSVKSTFSSWDKCMSKAYCKWPVIVGIVVGCLVILSLVWCIARCLCCGAEACCACISCCSCCASCCSKSRNRSKGYDQPDPNPTPQLQPYPQYQSAPPPMYGIPQQQQQPQYAQFDAHGGAARSAPYNEDALPAMPSWETSNTTRTPAMGNDMEMNRYNNDGAAAPMLPKSTAQSAAQSHYAGDIGMMSGPQYQETGYNNHLNGSPQMSYNDPYAGYGYNGSQQQSGTIRGGGYAQSTAPPPSYRTAPPTIVSPVGRKPVSGSWRDI